MFKVLFCGIWLLCASRGIAVEPVMLRMRLAQPGPVLAGSRVVIEVDVYATTFFSVSPVFDLPRLRQALLVEYDVSPGLETDHVGGQAYTRLRYELSFVALQAGTTKLPPFSVRFSAPPQYGATPVDYELRTPALTIEARAPPGTESLPGLIATRQLTVTETWEPKPAGTAQVGAGFTRRVTLTSPDLPAMALPPLPLTQAGGFTAYPKPPEVEDRLERGEFTARRVEAVTYVCEHAGPATLPGLEIPWWNTAKNRLEHVTLPGVTLQVAAAPVAPAPTDVGSVALRRLTREQLIWLAGGALAIICGGLGLFRRRHVLTTAWRERRRAREASEGGRFATLRAACAAGEPAAAYRALLLWLEARRAVPGIVTLAADLPADPGVLAAAADLEERIGRGAGSWDGAALGRALRQFQRASPGRVAYRRESVLPPLNPGGKA